MDASCAGRRASASMDDPDFVQPMKTIFFHWLLLASFVLFCITYMCLCNCPHLLGERGGINSAVVYFGLLHVGWAKVAWRKRSDTPGSGSCGKGQTSVPARIDVFCWWTSPAKVHY